MKVAILGSRGIPNYYGGFEQFAEYLSVGLVERGHDVTVYGSHAHPFKKDTFKGVQLKRVFDPEYKIGTAGQFAYDLLSILDTRKQQYDIILQLGYTSSSIFFSFHPKRAIVITNMDGLEWKRTKYTKKVQRFLEWAESLAVKRSNYLVSDSIGIQDYLKQKYNLDSEFIPYGSHVVNYYDEDILDEFGVKKNGFDMLIARLEPENSIEIILDGVVKSEVNRIFLVIGKHETKFGRYLKDRYKAYKNILFTGAVYDINKLSSLRYFANIYFHGHTVGGTNPSLLEAMGASALICANANEFNKTILGEDALYFNNSDDVKKVLIKVKKENYLDFIIRNKEKIMTLYRWDKIIDQYESFFIKCLKAKE